MVLFHVSEKRANFGRVGRGVVQTTVVLFSIRRRHLLAYIGIAILFLLIGVLVGNLHGWHECRWFYGVGTPSASHNTGSLSCAGCDCEKSPDAIRCKRCYRNGRVDNYVRTQQAGV